MEKNEIENLKNLKKLAASFLNLVDQPGNQTRALVTKIRLQNYFELSYTITDLLRLCILSLEQEEQKMQTNKKSAVNVAMILEMVIQLFPMEEFEFLSELNQLVFTDSDTSSE